MSPPTEEERLSSLASLAGIPAPSLPADELSRSVLRVGMIAEARSRGLTWRQVGSVLGQPDPKAAKAAAKRMARRVNRELAAQKVPVWEDGDG